MSIAEIIVISAILAVILIIGSIIVFKGIKINKASKPKKTPEKKEEVKPEVKEEKPLPVGIIREDKVENVNKSNDFAPFREEDKEKEIKIDIKNKNSKKSVAQQIKELSPEMKAILMSDIIKPKF